MLFLAQRTRNLNILGFEWDLTFWIISSKLQPLCQLFSHEFFHFFSANFAALQEIEISWIFQFLLKMLDMNCMILWTLGEEVMVFVLRISLLIFANSTKIVWISTIIRRIKIWVAVLMAKPTLCNFFFSRRCRNIRIRFLCEARNTISNTSFCTKCSVHAN